MKQLLCSLILSLLLIWAALSTLGGPYQDRLSPRSALAAPGDVYCVVSTTEVMGPLPACTLIFTDIQPAIDTATGGEEIRVGSGLYRSLHQRAGLTQVVYISKTVHLQGGYNSDFTTSDPAGNPTVLDAQGGGRVLYLTGSVSITLAGFDIIESIKSLSPGRSLVENESFSPDTGPAG